MAKAPATWTNRITRYGDESPDQLLAHPLNFRMHPKHQQDALSGVLSEVGVVQNIIVNERTGHVVDGHLRISLALRDNQPTVPVTYVDLSESEEALILATLDPISALATSDADKLAQLLEDVSTGDAALMQMISDTAEAAGVVDFAGTTGLTDPDEVPDPPAIPITQPGDLWLLGRHRLLCGDSTRADDVAHLLDGAKPALMVTDPPYGVELDQSWRDKALGDKAMGPGNRNLIGNDDRADWTEVWQLFTGDIAYVWHAGRFADNAGFEISQQLIWNKSVMVMGRSDYHFKHEPCWYAVRKGKTHSWIGDRTQTTVIEAKSPNHIMSGSDEAKTEHPTQKPVECMAYLIKNHSGDVYDPFLGSGTTLIAAEQLGRSCYGMEISPAYCDVIVQRYEAFTGQAATRETTAMAAD